MDITSIIQDVLKNQVVTGLSFTALLGGAAYQMRRIPGLVQSAILRFMTVQLTVMSTDETYGWLDRWFAAHPYTKKTKIMRLHALKSTIVRSNDDDDDEWVLSPGPGTHILWWKKRPIILSRQLISKEGIDGGARGTKPLEQIHLRTIGRSQSCIRALIAEARDMADEINLVPVRVWDEYSWVNLRGKSRRDLSTIILKAGQADRIIDDLRWFIAAKDWYLSRGIPYRRGYLFVGPPGTGKTSVVLALAGVIGRQICVLNMGSIQNDSMLFEAIRAVPLHAIVLIEDIDCAFPALSRVSDDEKGEGTSRTVSKAGLLNALDGITTPDGRIFIMTTNYPERLDEALVRPGRADVREDFGYFDAPEQEKMAGRFYPNFKALPFPVSPAEMQAVFMQYPNNPEAAHAVLSQKFRSTRKGNIIPPESVFRDQSPLSV